MVSKCKSACDLSNGKMSVSSAIKCTRYLAYEKTKRWEEVLAFLLQMQKTQGLKRIVSIYDFLRILFLCVCFRKLLIIFIFAICERVGMRGRFAI